MPVPSEGAFPGATNDTDASPDRADITAFIGVAERRMVYLALRSSMIVDVPLGVAIEQICAAMEADQSDSRRGAKIVRVLKALGIALADERQEDIPLWVAFESSGLLTSLQEKAVLSMAAGAFSAASPANRAKLLGCLLQAV